MDPQQKQSNQAQPVTNNTSTQSGPTNADDGDRIEKEWVSKVKQIISKTAHDPREQSKQFTELKTDYMQKRYGKVIKLEE